MESPSGRFIYEFFPFFKSPIYKSTEYIYAVFSERKKDKKQSKQLDK